MQNRKTKDASATEQEVCLYYHADEKMCACARLHCYRTSTWSERAHTRARAPRKRLYKQTMGRQLNWQDVQK